MAVTGRLGFRAAPANMALIEHAANLTGEPVAVFVRIAAEERAARVLREHEVVTTVPAEFFDELLAAFDAPAQPNPALTAAAARLRENVSLD